MLVGVLNLQVDVDIETAHYWAKDSKSLCEKIKGRFKVIAKSWNYQSNYGISIATLGTNEHKIQLLFEKIASFSEESGIGRVTTDVLFIDDMDIFREDDQIAG